MSTKNSKTDKPCTIHGVINWLLIDDNKNLFDETVRKNPNILIKFDTGQVREYSDDWPIAIAKWFSLA